MTGSALLDFPEPHHDVDEELAGILIRASRLGFSPGRVATALDISPAALACIDLAAPSGHRPPSR